MNSGEIIRMALESFGPEHEIFWMDDIDTYLEKFAELIAAAERAACADICTQAAKMSELAKEDLSGNETGAVCFVEGAVLQANKLCAAILARGQE